MKMKPQTANQKTSRKQPQLTHHNPSKTTHNQLALNPFRHNKCSQDLHPSVKTIRVSIQKSQEIGQNQYKKAVKHMMKLDSLEKKQKQRQTHQMQKLTSQHTFKPKINHPSQLNYLYESMTHSAQKLNFRSHSRQKDQKQKFYNRLMKWGKNHDDRVRDKYLKGKVSKESVERSFQSKVTNSRQKGQKLDNTRSSIQKAEERLLNSLRSSHQTKRQERKKLTNGEQSFYQRQAKAMAMRNGQKYYYSTNTHLAA